MVGKLSSSGNLWISVSVLFVVAFALVVASQPALGGTATLNPGLSPGIQPIATVNPSVIGNIINSYHTNSPLLYVVNNNTISVIEVSTNKVIDIIYYNADIELADAAVNGDYTRLYVLYYNVTEWEDSPQHDWNWEYPDYFIDTIDLSTKEIIASTRQTASGSRPINGNPVKMLSSGDGKYLYVMITAVGQGHSVSGLYRYDTAANAYTALLSDLDEKRSLSWVTDMTLGDDGYLYVADRSGHAVYRFAVPALDKYYRFSLWDNYAKEKLLWGLDINTKTGRVFIADTDNYHKELKSVTTLDMAAYDWYNWTGIGSFPTTGSPSLVTLSPGGGVLYVLEPTAKAVEAFSAPTYNMAASYATGNSPADIALSPDGARLYVSNSGDDTVTAVDLSTGTPFPGTPIKVGHLPKRLVMGPQPQGNISVNNSELRSRIRENLQSGVRPLPRLPGLNSSSGSSTGGNNSTIGGGLVLVDPNIGAFTRIKLTDLTPPGSTPGNETAPGNNSQAGNATGDGYQAQASPAATVATPTGQATTNPTGAGASATPGPGGLAALLCIAAAIALTGLRRK